MKDEAGDIAISPKPLETKNRKVQEATVFAVSAEDGVTTGH
jgi:hypothetical protein